MVGRLHPDSCSVRATGLLARLAGLFVLGFLVLGLPAGAAPEMALSGQWNVTNTGAFTYTIPLRVPPGTHGLAPHLALTYSSQAGDGHLGLGWSIAGLSAITRCPQTWAQDNEPGGVTYTANDRFCLDGQRLVATNNTTYGANGSTYQLEVTNYESITLTDDNNGQPLQFDVYLRDGTHYQYGGSTDSNILAAQNTDLTRVWALHQITDTKDNAILFSYYNNSLEYYITEIDYSGNKITFGTRERTYDKVQTYQAGYEMLMTQLISAIHTYAGGTPVLDYTLTYNNARSGTASQDELATIQECQHGGTGQCLPATQLTWQGSPGGFYLNYNTKTPSVDGYGYPVTPGDFDADGIVDVVVSTPNCGTGNVEDIYFGNGDGFDFSSTGTNGSMNASYDYYGYDSDVPDPYSGPACFNVEGLNINIGPNIIVADINGDGISDIVADEWYWLENWHGIPGWTPIPNSEVLITGGQTVTQESADGKYSWPSVMMLAGSTFPSDLNNDGLPDAVDPNSGDIWLGDGSGNFKNSNFTISDSVTAVAGDFDGDDCTDVLNGSNVYFSPLCEPAVKSAPVPWSTVNSNMVFGDFNGDHKTDVIVYSSTGAGEVDMYLSTGTGFSGPINICGNCDWTKYAVVTGDWNGDGKTDIALISTTGGGTSEFWMSGGDGFNTSEAKLAFWELTAAPVVADWNNDGASDIWIGNATGDSNPTEVLFSYTPELMTGVSNGLGATTSVNYGRLNDPSNGMYTNPREDSYPIQDVNGPFYVPQKITVTGTGTSDNLNWTFAYTELKKDLLGRGLLGFKSIATTDPNGKVRTISYNTTTTVNGVDVPDFPYIGLPASDTVQETANGTTLSSLLYTWSDQGGAGTFFPYVSQTVFTGADPGGGNLPEVDTGFTVDSYGNIQTKTVSHPHSDGFTSTTTNQYQYNTNPWIVNELTSSTVENVLGSSNMTRVTTYNPEQATGLVDGVIIQPGGGNLELDIGYEYDKFGNPQQITVTDPGDTIPGARQTNLYWGTTGQFLQTETNALNYQSAFTFDARFGTETSVTDPNNITESWVTDPLGRPSTFTTPAGATTTQNYVYCASQSCQPISGVPAVTAAFYVETTVTAGGSNLAPIAYTYYDAFSRVVAVDKQTFAGGGWIRTETSYDTLGRLNAVTQPYPATGSASASTTYGGYDALNRVGTVTYPVDGGSGSATTGYTYSALQVKVTDTYQHVTTTTRNPEGLVSDVNDADGKDTTYSYDAFGDAVTISSPAKNAVQNTFDLLGRKIQSVDPDMGTWAYTYDGFGELTSQTSPNEAAGGLTTQLGYDQLGRLTSRSEPDMYSTWTWDTAANGIGRLASAACAAPANPPPNIPDACPSGGYARSYSYDVYGRQYKLTLQISPQTQGPSYYSTEYYDANTTQLTMVRAFSGFTVNYNYNAQGFLCEISDYSTGGKSCGDPYSQIYWEANNADVYSHIVQETAGNSLVTTRDYSQTTGNLQGIAVGPGYNVENMTYSWDNVGNLLSRVDSLNGIAEGFCYDALNRLQNYSVSNNGGTNCSSGNLLIKSMTYDAGGDGNIETKSDVGSYNYAGQGPHAVSSITTGNTQLDGVANPSFFYDRDGNMACVTTHTVCGGNAARLYSWTTFDMLEVAQQGANSVAFSYTPEHERFTQTTASATLMYANDPVGGIMSERLAGSTITWRTYLMAYGRIVAERFAQGASATMDYVAGDHLMSTAALSNTASQNLPYAIAEKDSWDAWGKRRNINGSDNANCSITSGTLRGFTGQEMMDSFCLVNLNGRVYDPTIGRFLSADPTVPDPLNGQALNRYSYVLNNPLALVDPSGYADTCNDSDKCQIYSEGNSPESYCACAGSGFTYDSMDNLVPVSSMGIWNVATTLNGVTTTQTVDSLTELAGALSSTILGAPDPVQLTMPGWTAQESFTGGMDGSMCGECTTMSVTGPKDTWTVQGAAIFAGATGAWGLAGGTALFVCGLAEPCGGIAAGVGGAAFVGGLLSGLSARATGLTNQNGLAASAFVGGIVSGATGGASAASEISGTVAVGVGTGSAFLGGFGGTLAGQAAAGQSLNVGLAMTSGVTSAIGYFGGGSFAVDALGLPLNSFAGLATSINSTIVGTSGVFIANHLF